MKFYEVRLEAGEQVVPLCTHADDLSPEDRKRIADEFVKRRRDARANAARKRERE